MKRALFCANYNNALCENSRASFQHAAERWGAEYIEANEGNHKCRLHPATVKMEAFDVTDADAAFIIDCDTIINGRAPNPFETLPAGAFSAVGMSQRLDPDGHLQWLGTTHEWRDKLNVLPGVEPLDPGDWRYFNSGMMLAYRSEHKAAMDLALSICRIPNQMGWIEQTPIQYALKKLGCVVHYADERWNLIHPMSVWPDSFLEMAKTGAYVYHGAGDPSRLQWLPRVQWQ